MVLLLLDLRITIGFCALTAILLSKRSSFSNQTK